MNIIESETPFLVEARTCGCKERGLYCFLSLYRIFSQSLFRKRRIVIGTNSSL